MFLYPITKVSGFTECLIKFNPYITGFISYVLKRNLGRGKPYRADVELFAILTHLTYFARLFMLYHMLNILIDKQLDICLIYLIYN